MKNIKMCIKKGLGILLIIPVMIIFELSLSSCSTDDLEIQQNFPFEIELMPVSKYVAEGETIEIRCRIVSSGNFSGTEYFIRCFQTEGKGSLRLYNEPPFTPNDTYPLSEKEFRLYYTSESKVSQSFDVWIEDNMGNERKVSFEFSPQNAVAL